jgi:hypothetical protein
LQKGQAAAVAFLGLACKRRRSSSDLLYRISLLERYEPPGRRERSAEALRESVLQIRNQRSYFTQVGYEALIFGRYGGSISQAQQEGRMHRHESA